MFDMSFFSNIYLFRSLDLTYKYLKYFSQIKSKQYFDFIPNIHSYKTNQYNEYDKAISLFEIN